MKHRLVGLRWGGEGGGEAAGKQKGGCWNIPEETQSLSLFRSAAPGLGGSRLPGACLQVIA